MFHVYHVYVTSLAATYVLNNSITITVKIETLCSRFYAVISGTSGAIDRGSSRECLKINRKIDNLIFALDDLFLTKNISKSNNPADKNRSTTGGQSGPCQLGRRPILWPFPFTLSIRWEVLR